MRIAVNTIDEFLECLSNEESIFGGTIRVSVNSNPVNPLSNVKMAVSINASAVVTSGDNEYLLQVGEHCGIDYIDSTNEKKGTEVAGIMKGRIKMFAASKGWKVLPGIISE